MNKLIRILLCCVFFSLAWACDDDNNDGPAAKQNEVSLGSKEFKTLENITPLRIPVTLSGPAANDVTVTGYVRSENNAREGVDYTFVSKEIVIPAGASTGYFEVEIKDNPVYTPDRMFEFEIVEVKGGVLSALDVCRVTISSDEGLPVIGFEQTLVTTSEEMISLDLRVVIDRVWNKDISFRLHNLPELSTAVNGEHYSLDTLKTYTIVAGDTAVVIPVALTDDPEENENRYFELKLYAVEGAVLSEVYETMKVTIADDEEPIFVSFDKTALEAVESEGPVWVPVRVKGQNKMPVKVTLEVRGGSAVEGTDYTFEQRELTFAAGAKLDSVRIDFIDNNVYELDRTLQIGFAAVEGAALASTDTLVNVKILNDDFDYKDLYDQLMGSWTLAMKEKTVTVTIAGGDTPEEEDQNYLKRLIMTVSGLGNSGKTARIAINYDAETGRMTVPMKQVVVSNVKPWESLPYLDIILYFTDGGSPLDEDGEAVLEWDKAYKTCTWNTGGKTIWGMLCPTGTFDLEALNMYDIAMTNVTMTRNE